MNKIRRMQAQLQKTVAQQADTVDAGQGNCAQKSQDANPTSVPVIAHPVETKQQQVVVKPPHVSTTSRFTKEMVFRAHEEGIAPHQLLYTIAHDPSVRFKDFLVVKGELIEIERGATPQERIQCAVAVMPYYASKKPVEVAHQGRVEILHSIAQSPLDAVTIDEHGQVIDDADDAEFEEIE